MLCVVVAALSFLAPCPGLRVLPAPGLRHLPASSLPAKIIPRITVHLNESPERPPYYISGWSRPRYRGSFVRWLHATRAWYIIAFAYVVAAVRLPSSPLPLQALALRVLAAGVTSINIFVSNGYHNTDRRGEDAMTPEAELAWLRWDYFVISWILTYNSWLWASHLGWNWNHCINIAHGICTATVAAFARLATLSSTSLGHLGAVGTMGVQYFAPFAYLLVVGGSGLAFSLCLAVFLTYGLGLLLWILRFPRNEKFGYHELFHVSVIAGHLVSMGCDLRVIL